MENMLKCEQEFYPLWITQKKIFQLQKKKLELESKFIKRKMGRTKGSKTSQK